MRPDRRVLPIADLTASAFGIRPGEDADGPALIALIRACWAEYEDCVLDVDREAPELRHLASHVAGQGGVLFLARGGLGMVAAVPGPDAGWTIERLYVAASARGTGLSHALLDRVETTARDAGARRLNLHSDTRFIRAHAFYEKRSFLRGPRLRVLHDLANTVEYQFTKPLSGLVVELLDFGGAASAVSRLANILVDCVAAGASVSFIHPLSQEAARAFWLGAAARAAAGQVVLFAAWLDGVLAGTVTLDLDTKPNQRHRADIAKLLVHPEARRRGLADALMARAEDVAWRSGRTLLVLDTMSGSPGERLYRARGWTEAGGIPNYSRDAIGNLEAMTLFYKDKP